MNFYYSDWLKAQAQFSITWNLEKNLITINQTLSSKVQLPYKLMHI